MDNAGSKPFLDAMETSSAALSKLQSDINLRVAVEMPGRITSMDNIGGRLIVTIEDGRTIDMTDWFADGSEQPQ